jgi:hypothetical protein
MSQWVSKVAWVCRFEKARQERRKGSKKKSQNCPKLELLQRQIRDTRVLVAVPIILELYPRLHFHPNMLTVHNKSLITINRPHQAILTRLKEERYTDPTSLRRSMLPTNSSGRRTYRGRTNTMHRRDKSSTRYPRHQIANVDYQRLRNIWRSHPFSGRVLHFQTASRILMEQRQNPTIGVRRAA